MSTKLNFGIAIMSFAIATQLVADHYNATQDEIANELEAARISAEQDMALYF